MPKKNCDAATEGKRRLRNDEIPFLYPSPNVIAREHARHGSGIHQNFYLVREDIL
jgi:hypothetical protein